jgi:hypothetical protein
MIQLRFCLSAFKQGKVQSIVVLIVCILYQSGYLSRQKMNPKSFSYERFYLYANQGSIIMSPNSGTNHATQKFQN